MDTSAADALARELNTQAKQHPRVSMLLVPNVKEQDGQLVIDLYWMDRETSFCTTRSCRSPTTPTRPSTKPPSKSSTRWPRTPATNTNPRHPRREACQPAFRSARLRLAPRNAGYPTLKWPSFRPAPVA